VTNAQRIVGGLRAFALLLPEAYEDHPWGDDVIKVGKRIFVFLGHPDHPPGISVKQPRSAPYALSLGCCEPTGYGLGRRGWVSVHIDAAGAPSRQLLEEWVLESYAAIATKSLVKRIAAGT
jgi:predicted DNA-binding protein (MmcQ/YjbR family)